MGWMQLAFLRAGEAWSIIEKIKICQNLRGEGDRTVKKKWNEVPTSTFMRQLFQTSDLPNFFRQNRQTMTIPALTEYLRQLCADRGLVPERVIRAASIDRTYGHQIFNGTRRPSRDKVLQLAFGLGVGVEETQRLLRLADRSPLYPKLRRDAVILYCLGRGRSLAETQEMLQSMELTILGGDNGYGG